jgi:murein DD-endopeptidase MepM/ murein hydrolase activator NlpD
VTTNRIGVMAMCAMSVSLIAAQSTVDGQNSLEARVIRSPAIVRVDGEPHLVYELHVTNSGSAAVTLTQVDVLRGPVALHSYGGTELLKSLAAAGTGANAAEPQQLDAGGRAIFYAWLAVAPGEMPARIRHRIAYRTDDGASRSLDAGDLGVVPDASVELESPLRGGPWVAIYDPDLRNGHRRRVSTLDGEAHIPARFAIDWIKLGSDGRSLRDGASGNASSYSYGEDVLAVADAVVAGIEDRLPEPTPNISIANEAGNYIALDLGGNRFAFYEHLKPGSVRVALHERVRAGQILASVGASGSVFSGPHLHFHVADANAPVAGEGLPFRLRTYRRLGSFPSFDAFNRPWVAATNERPVTRSGEMPAPLTVVRF